MKANRRNPIMTHRHLGLEYPIVGTGHADLVETQFGEWWMVLLAMRPYGGYFYNLGRETFLVPVRWEDGWPVVGAGSGRVETVGRAPNLPEHRWPSLPVCDHFETQTLAPQWNFLRTPRDDFWSLSARPGYLRLRLRPERLTDLANPSFVGRRQQHMRFVARAALEFKPQHDYECAGLVLLQNNEFHFRFVITGGAATIVRLVKRSTPEPSSRLMPIPTRHGCDPGRASHRRQSLLLQSGGGRASLQLLHRHRARGMATCCRRCGWAYPEHPLRGRVCGNLYRDVCQQQRATE